MSHQDRSNRFKPQRAGGKALDQVSPNQGWDGIPGVQPCRLVLEIPVVAGDDQGSCRQVELGDQLVKEIVQQGSQFDGFGQSPAMTDQVGQEEFIQAEMMVL